MLAHIPALRRYARLLTGDANKADDLVQDTLERACQKWSLWKPGSTLRPWLFTLMHNLYLNQRRDWRHDNERDDIDGIEEPSWEPMSHMGQQMDMHKALSLLPPAMREVLLLVSVEEYSYAETAGILDVPVGTVMSRLHRAREQMRLLLEGSLPQSATPLHLVKK